MPEFLSRTQWRARPPTSSGVRLVRGDVRGVCLHWPGSSDVLRGDDVAAALRGWQRYHVEQRGWRDIAYNYACDQQGRIWTCRGVNLRGAANGSQVANGAYLSVVCVVAQAEPVSPELVTAMHLLIRYVRKVYPRAVRIVGHGEIRPAPTECPGPAVRRLVRVGAFEPAPTR
jgi:N-acetyl-anhydromuramyl-L-alanine amidase AmpD